MGLEYVDIFYSHRPDPDTPLWETLGALDHAVRQGKALYAGVSNYKSEMTKEATKILNNLGTPCLINQPSYSMFNRWLEGDGLLKTIDEVGIGCIVYSPLAQGMLTDKYLKGIPDESRAAKEHGFLKRDQVTAKKIEKVKQLGKVAKIRNQTMSQLALSWTLRHKGMTSALIGASSVAQIKENAKSIENTEFSKDELGKIDEVLAD